MHAAIRVDGGPDIGFGHLIRSRALAKRLLDGDASVSVATATPTHARDVFPDRASIVELPSRSESGPFCDWLEGSSVDVTFTDAYPVATAYQRAVRERVPLVVLQDDDRHAVAADVFVNGNLYAESLEYEFTGSRPVTLLGPEYVLLRSDIVELARSDSPWREEARRAIVTFGGSDTANLTPTALRAFDGFDVHVDVVVGPGFSERQETAIREVAADVSAPVDVLRNPDHLPELLFQADFGLTTASTTIYEMLALGTPVVCCTVAENQRRLAASLATRELATVVERREEPAPFARAIEEYVSDPGVREDRRRRGTKLVDGEGAARISDELLAVARESDTSSVTGS